MEEVLFVTKKPTYEIVVTPDHQKEVNGTLITVRGKTITFSLDGEYRTSDPEEIALIRSKKTFGTDVQEIDPSELKEIKDMEDSGMISMNSITHASECPYCSRKFISKVKLEQHMIVCPKKEK